MYICLSAGQVEARTIRSSFGHARSSAANRGLYNVRSEVPLMNHGRWSSSHSLKNIAANLSVLSGTEWLEPEPKQGLSDYRMVVVVAC